MEVHPAHEVGRESLLALFFVGPIPPDPSRPEKQDIGQIWPVLRIASASIADVEKLGSGQAMTMALSPDGIVHGGMPLAEAPLGSWTEAEQR